MNLLTCFILSLFRPDATKKKQSLIGLSTNYQGTLSDNITVEPTEEGINFELLKQKEQILFYHDLTLFEDELHDHGISKLSVKIVSFFVFFTLKICMDIKNVLKF